MAVTFGDRVQETFTTTGTGTISLGGAVVGYQAFSAVVSNAGTCYYAATDGTNWEVGLGTYATSGDTLARTTILASSNSGSAVSWSSGTKNIWLDLPATTINSFGYTGLRNRIINGSMRIDQRNAGASQTISTTAYTVDRFYASATGASVTGQQVAGSGADQNEYKFTGAASVTAIAFGQRIEAANIYDLNSTTATLSVKLSNSLLTTVTWTAYYPTATDNWASRTQIATGTFTVNSTPTVYSAQIALGANVTAGLEIELTVGAQTSGTWTITEFQLENGSVATPFERRPIGLELALCKRYYQTTYDLGTAPASATHLGMVYFGFMLSDSTQGSQVTFPVIMRSAPTVSVWDGAGTSNKNSVTLNSGTSFTDGISLATSPWNISTGGFLGSGNGTNGDINYIHYAASAEL